MIAVGGLIVALIVLGYRDVLAHQRARLEERHVERFPEGIAETDFGVPVALRVFYAVVVGGAVYLVVWMWWTGYTF
jgi:hypothetical protein